MDAVRLCADLRELKATNRSRDKVWADLRSVRDNRPELVHPDLFSEDWPKPITANHIDTIARDVAEMMSRIPSVNAGTANVSEAARKRADEKTKVCNYYLETSRMGRQHLAGADHYNTYGVEVAYVEPDFEGRCPRITIEDPRGGYGRWDRWGRLVAYYKTWRYKRRVLADMYPLMAPRILRASVWSDGEDEVELVRYCDSDRTVLMVNDEHPFTLAEIPNRLGRIPVELALRPSLADPNSGETRGQFDDVVWVQLARNHAQMLMLEAAEKSVRAPLQVPFDVGDVPLGPDATISTDGQVRRVVLEVPEGIFAENSVLTDELMRGARYSPARAGHVDASIITGRGVEALQGGMTAQFAAAQVVFEDFFAGLLALCMEMDEVYWGGAKKRIQGRLSGGSPFTLEYDPAKTFNGDYTIDISYGLGLDPARESVLLLQLRGDKVLSRDTFQRLSQIGIDVEEEKRKVDIEDMRESLILGVRAQMEAIPAMAQQGQDPSPLLAAVAAVIRDREKGRPIEEAIAEAFAPPEPEPVPDEPMPEELPAPPMGGGGMPFGEGAPPDLQQLLAGITNTGRPTMAARTMRQRSI